VVGVVQVVGLRHEGVGERRIRREAVARLGRGRVVAPEPEVPSMLANTVERGRAAVQRDNAAEPYARHRLGQAHRADVAPALGAARGEGDQAEGRVRRRGAGLGGPELRARELSGWAQKMQVGPCIPVGIQL
jgi:hypothetical protein